VTEIGIKFKCEWIEDHSLSDDQLGDIDYWRDKLYDLKMIGEGSDGIGYGNISRRVEGDKFVISGATTGKLKDLSEHHYTMVTGFDIDTNSLSCRGPIVASSESMTHGTIYRLNNTIGAVIHIHNSFLWEKYLNKLPTTSQAVEYGTPSMAREIIRLYKESNLSQKRVLVMAGHQDGLVSFGENLQEATQVLISLQD
jgi:L-ribulose-5-phosphate 4-epimerase